VITVPETWTNDARALILHASGLAGLIPPVITPGDAGARLAIAVEPDLWGGIPELSVVSVVSQHATPRSLLLAELDAAALNLIGGTAVDRRFMTLLARAAGRDEWPRAPSEGGMLREFADAKVCDLES